MHGLLVSFVYELLTARYLLPSEREELLAQARKVQFNPS
jgi:hypothetical protein